MDSRRLLGALIALASLLVIASTSIEGQTDVKTVRAQIGLSKTWVPPRTPDGLPDLQGVWDFSLITPVERPANFAGREFLTDQEIVELQRQASVAATDESRSPDAKADLQKAYNRFWWDSGTKVVATRRTSLIIDPPDGQIPPLTAGALAKEAERRKVRQHPGGPEDFELKDRCLTGFNAGPPMLPNAYNNNVQLFQSRGYVVVLNEMIHNARIVPLDGRPHLSSSIQQWVGDSRGRWDGETLVIDTKNFTEQGLGLFMGGWGFRGPGDENMHVTERFTRLGPDLLLYEATVEDPTTYTKPWTVSLTMTKSKERIYEYACHEGNHSLPNTLSGERADERRGTKATAVPSASSK